MKNTITVTITSLLTILFATFHLADDIARGFSPGGFSNLAAILFLVVWLYATVVLPERRSGLVIILVGSLLASGLPVIHMTGKGLGGGRIAGSSGAFFFVWTLIAAGVTAIFSLILSARGLWSLRRGQPRS
jgi:hypothetical protein